MDIQNTPELSIHEAASKGDLDTVQWWIETRGASVNEVDDTNYSEFTVLHCAAQDGHKQIVEFLLAQGATVDVKNKHNNTPLTLAIAHKHVPITQLLLAKGADPDNITDEFSIEGGNLHVAAKTGCPTIINQLIQHGALPDSQENLDRCTALHIAVQNRQPASILALYPHVDITLRDSYNVTPVENLIDFIAHDASERNMQCLYAFLCAGAEITEAVISQTVGADQFPVVKSIIQNAITLKEQVEEQFNYPKPELVLHILLQSPEERAALLREKTTLEGLGYKSTSGMHRFLCAPENGKADFLSSQEVFLKKNIKLPEFREKRSILDLPPELLQMIVEHFLQPAADVEVFKPVIAHDESLVYTSPRLS